MKKSTKFGIIYILLNLLMFVLFEYIGMKSDTNFGIFMSTIGVAFFGVACLVAMDMIYYLGDEAI